MFFESYLLNFLVALFLIIALTFDYVTKFFSYWYVRHIPYKTPVPFYGSDYHRVLGLRSNTKEVNTLYCQHQKEHFVGCIKSRMPDLIVKDPELIKKVLSTDFDSFKSRGLDLDRSQDVCIRNNLFYADGEKWTLLREGFELLLNDVTYVEGCLSECLPGTNGDTNVQQLLSKVLDDVFKNLLHDVDGSIITDLRSEIQKLSLVDKVKSYIKIIFPSLYILFGLTTLSEQLTARATKTIKQSKLNDKIRSLFEIDIKEKNRKLNNKSDNFTVGIVATFITEGYIPCLNLLTALFYQLARHPLIQQKVRNSNEEYLDAVIKESLRLNPPYSVLSRKCVATYKFPDSKVLVDRGVTLSIPVDAIHKDGKYYTEAEVFNPDRFLSGDSAAYSNVFLPFGAGPRKCIGEKLALQIIKGVTTAILERFEVQPSEKTLPQLPVADYNFGRVIDKDIWLTFKPIKS